MTSGNDDGNEFVRLVADTRLWLAYWALGGRLYKAHRERDAVQTVLSGAGLEVHDIRSLKNDPPDCEATVNGLRCGIEVTELVQEKLLTQSINTVRVSNSGLKPEKPAAHFIWGRKDFLKAVQDIINRKDMQYKRRALRTLLPRNCNRRIVPGSGECRPIPDRGVFPSRAHH
jgi:hypothetical protein